MPAGTGCRRPERPRRVRSQEDPPRQESHPDAAPGRDGAAAGQDHRGDPGGRDRRRPVRCDRGAHRAGLGSVYRRRQRRLSPRRRRASHLAAPWRCRAARQRPAPGAPLRDARAPPGRPLSALRWADVDLRAVRANAARILAHVPPGTRLMAVVKANGYGHGAVPVARAALGGGATWLAVATLEEARELTGLAHVERILVMGGLVPDQAAAAAAGGFSIGVSSLDFARALGDSDEVVPVHLKIDTGMGRFGSAPHEAAALAKFINDSPGLRLAGTWTHFASAGTDEAMTRLQFDRFLAAAGTLGVEPGLRHACNSAAAYRFPEMALDAVRVGIALYGCDWPGASPALALRSVVTHVKSLAAGETVGYGATWTARNHARVATVAIGYADGVMRARANRGHVLVRGRPAALIGAVSMDAITVDVTGVPGVEVGDVVTLIGTDGDDRITAEEVAE